MRRSVLQTALHPGRVLVIPLLVMALAVAPTVVAQPLPNDPKPTCTVSQPVFNSWFQSGSVTVNGIVNPANSVSFPNTPNCSFYQWSQQMFLWLTSPSPSRYGPGAHVLDSSVFYDI